MLSAILSLPGPQFPRLELVHLSSKAPSSCHTVPHKSQDSFLVTPLGSPVYQRTVYYLFWYEIQRPLGALTTRALGWVPTSVPWMGQEGQ